MFFSFFVYISLLGRVDLVESSNFDKLSQDLQTPAVERAYNLFWSLKEPHCAVCVLFSKTEETSEVMFCEVINVFIYFES